MGFHVGQTFGDYSITAVLGAGGTGRVYKVEHLLTRRTEAMKVLIAELASEVQVKRFEREMRALARLSHPNIGALYNARHSENQLILFMEYIDGETLEAKFGRGRLPLDKGIGYIKQTLSALGYAHQQGIVHRDVTPANVMIAQGNEVKLTDFGLSKSYGDALLTNCGEVLGSLPYLAPEQLKGSTQPDRRSDLYSVGAILYEHLTGQKPFGANRRLAPVLTDSEREPAAPSQLEPALDRQWDEIIRRALARDPAHRYQSADEFLTAIAGIQEPSEDVPLPQVRNWGIGAALAAGLMLALAASPVLTKLGNVPHAAPPWPGVHIAPPAFAFAIPQTYPLPQVARTADILHGKMARRSLTIPLEGSAAGRPRAVTAQAYSTAMARHAALGPGASSAAPAPDLNAPIAAETADSSPPQGPMPAKKSFWSKLNVFKKKSDDGKDKP